MKRRDFVKLSAGAVGAMSFPHRLQAQPNTPPNVALIIMDDLNDWCGCLGGHPQAETPNLDWLASQGTLFSNAHCSAPHCLPSRTSFLTSKKPSTLGVYTNNDDFWPDAIEGMPNLPAYFRDNGYYSILSGKVFHGGQPDGTYDVRKAHHADPRPFQRPANGFATPLGNDLDWYPLDIDLEDMFDYEQIGWIANQLQSAPENQPKFLAVNMFSCHLPWAMPKEYFRYYDPLHVSLPEGVLAGDTDDLPQIAWENIDEWRDESMDDYNQRRNAVAAYLASIRLGDIMLGRMFDQIGDFLFDPNTIIMLTSDHGNHTGEKLHWLKGTLWERSTRVPLIVKSSSYGAPGQLCSEPVNLIDMFPTLVDMAGLPEIAELEGEDLVPLLENPSLHREVPSLTTFHQGSHAVRTQRWRYIRYSDLSEELYDHDNDPYEWTNLAGDPQYNDLKAQLASWMPDDLP